MTLLTFSITRACSEIVRLATDYVYAPPACPVCIYVHLYEIGLLQGPLCLWPGTLNLFPPSCALPCTINKWINHCDSYCKPKIRISSLHLSMILFSLSVYIFKIKITYQTSTSMHFKISFGNFDSLPGSKCGDSGGGGGIACIYPFTLLLNLIDSRHHRRWARISFAIEIFWNTLLSTWSSSRLFLLKEYSSRTA